MKVKNISKKCGLRGMKGCVLAAVMMCSLISGSVYAQNDQQKQKTPEEVAIEETAKLEEEFKLTPSQTFYVDSILRCNYTGMKNQMENMRAEGMEDARNFKTVQNIWIQKNLDALKTVFTEQQYIRYLKMIGRGKEYRRGKGGIYYKKGSKKKDRKK
ncbi:MAG: hypothetical protein LKI53_06365 [Bacteroidales bacterium]|jgi:hypothetical protein|nr:hypothetical protein [Bacteroidales bacterium]